MPADPAGGPPPEVLVDDPTPAHIAAEDPTGPLPRRLLAEHHSVDARGALSIGGCDVADLAAEYGTPLFVYDEAQLRSRCREAVATFGDGVAYASKAFLCRAMAQLAHEEGMHIDVATGGELHVARSAGVPGDRLVMHGNNKSEAELELAISEGVGRIVVDSFDELDRLGELGTSATRPVRILLRVTPGVEAHTHEFVSTGQNDSKFGFTVSDGTAQRAVDTARANPGVELVGIHAHIGSQVFASSSFARAVEVLAQFSVPLRLEELSVGGGLGVPYVCGEWAPSIAEWGAAVLAACAEQGVTAWVSAEPGRAIAAAAGLTVYTAGTIKQIEGVRTYLSVDGGMSDNPRPVLYGSGYEAFMPGAVEAQRPRRVRIVGKHCESGDLLVREAQVPDELGVGDLVATPVTGAYGHSMGSNYNKVLRPPVVFASGGVCRQVVRRETFDDLTRLDV